jgi:hypothetical protein
MGLIKKQEVYTMIRTGIECLLEMAKNDNDHCYENLNAEIGKMKLSNILSSMEPLKI